MKFELKQMVKITTSGEQGVIVGRAEYSIAEPNYLLHYTQADGRAAEQWWGEFALEVTEAPNE